MTEAALLEETVGILRDLIAFPTVSSDGNLELILHINEMLKSVGARTDIQVDGSGAKANLFATLGPEIDGGIILSGHTDVVPVADQAWSSDPFVMTERDGRLYGRGACDMKGFVAATLAMAPRFAASALARPVHFAFTYDEEVGCLGGRALMERLSEAPVKPAVAIIGEPTEMRVVEAHKGCYEYTVSFEGLEGHGATPDRCVNAVEYAVRYVAKLMALGDALKARAPAGSPFEPPWTTVSVGRLSGGVAHNVVPARATVDWEMRPVQGSDANLVKTELAAFVETELAPAMRAVHADASITTEVIGEVVGLEPAEASEAARIVSELTGDEARRAVSFGTEAGLFQGVGISAVVCGPGSIDQAHKPDEYVSRDQLGQAIGMLRGLEDRLRAP
ncbi:MAG: acetylornithine deacetylase [Pseudomonadota bacterium]